MATIIEESSTNPPAEFYQPPKIGFMQKGGFTPAEIVNDARKRISIRANLERPTLITLRNRGIPGAEELLRNRDGKLVLVGNNFIADPTVLTEFHEIDERRMIFTIEGRKVVFMKMSLAAINLHYLYRQSPCLTHLTYTEDTINYLDTSNHESLAVFPLEYAVYQPLNKYKPTEMGPPINMIWKLRSMGDRLARIGIAFVDTVPLYVHPATGEPAILDFTDAVLMYPCELPLNEFPVEIRANVDHKQAFLKACKVILDLPWSDEQKLRMKKTIMSSFEVAIE